MIFTLTKEEQKEIDKSEWNELYQYIKDKIFHYDCTMKLPRFLILRLNGIRKGVFISNKKTKPLGNYTYKEILYAFKFSSIELSRVTANKSRFKDEKHLINTIMLIVENNINDVVFRLRNIKKVEEKADTVNIVERKPDIEYVNKGFEKSEVFKEKVKDLWK